MSSLITTYSGSGLQPFLDPDQARTMVVALPASKFIAKGTVLGQILGTGTAVNEVQTITPGGTVSGGTWIIVYDGEYTSSLAYNANAATVQAALEALTSIGTGNIAVAGGPLNSGAFTLTFQASLGGLHHPLVSVINSLTGTTPTATPSLTTLGKPAGGYWDAYNDGASGSEAGLATARMILQLDCRMDSQGRVFNTRDKNFTDFQRSARNAVAFFSGTFKTADLTGLDANGVTDLGRLISGTTSVLSADSTILRMG